MTDEQREGLAEKIMSDALENIRRLGYVPMYRVDLGNKCYVPEKIEMKDVRIVSEKDYSRGNY